MIEFTQYLLPDGRRRITEIERSDDIEAMAKHFIDSGGRFESELLSDLQTVSLTAVHKINDEDDDIAIVICKNGPDIPEAVDKLVLKAIAFFGSPKQSGS